MSDLQDLVALSLLAPWRWRTAAEHLRNGESPRDVLDRLLAEGPADKRHTGVRLRARAATGR